MASGVNNFLNESVTACGSCVRVGPFVQRSLWHTDDAAPPKTRSDLVQRWRLYQAHMALPCRVAFHEAMFRLRLNIS
jgi:hypothetical protein